MRRPDRNPRIRFSLTVSNASFAIPVCLERASAAAAQAARDTEADPRPRSQSEAHRG